MKRGILFPATEIGHDPQEVLEWAKGVEELGYDQVQINGHLLGMDPAVHERIPTPYTSETTFLDPFVVVPFIAAVTSRVYFMTSVLILTSRQAAVVAKQAADTSVLSNGRLILGVGVGYNPLESEATGTNFRDRGRRIEEQMEVMRAFWTQPSVTYHGKFHDINGLGIAPRPKESVPIWMGGTADAVIDRVGRLADGYVRGAGTPPEQLPALIDAIKASVAKAGRDADSFPIGDQLMVVPTTGPDDWSRFAASRQELGVSHVLFSTVRNGFTTAREHLVLAQRVIGSLHD